MRTLLFLGGHNPQLDLIRNEGLLRLKNAGSQVRVALYHGQERRREEIGLRARNNQTAHPFGAAQDWKSSDAVLVFAPVDGIESHCLPAIDHTGMGVGNSVAHQRLRAKE